MAETITFRGVTIWTDAAGDGAGYQFTAASVVPEPVEVPSPLGVGTWIKPGNSRAADHQLDIEWVTATPMTVKALVDGLAGITRGSLVVPSHGTINNVRLADIAPWEQVRVADGYHLRTILTFRQYP